VSISKVVVKALLKTNEQLFVAQAEIVRLKDELSDAKAHIYDAQEHLDRMEARHREEIEAARFAGRDEERQASRRRLEEEISSLRNKYANGPEDMMDHIFMAPQPIIPNTLEQIKELFEGIKSTHTLRLRIRLIKEVRARTNLGLKEAKDLVESYWPYQTP
jgi:hypothetical protein